MAQIESENSCTIPLVKMYPDLGYISRFPILNGPTPLKKMSHLEKSLLGKDSDKLWVKRDDLSSQELGGNKARKLEYLLAKARQESADELITFGMWGSNHALATAEAAHALHLKSTLHLGPQPPTPDVRKKLLAMHALGGKLVFHNGQLSLGLGIAESFIRSVFSKKAFFIPPGGSNALSTLGYVNAFLEFQQQWKENWGNKPLPNRIFVPMGTAGTAAGLLVGSCLAEAQEQTQIIAVGISHSPISNGRSVTAMASRTYDFIKQHLFTKAQQERLPQCDWKKNFVYLKEFSAPGYGAAGKLVYDAMELLNTQENLILDPTYSGKAFLAMLTAIKTEQQDGREVPSSVFWLTYNAHPLEEIIAKYPWKNPNKPYLDLPKKFHFLFE